MSLYSSVHERNMLIADIVTHLAPRPELVNRAQIKTGKSNVCFLDKFFPLGRLDFARFIMGY